MPDLFITRRPIVLETGASAAALTDILGRIEGITGRASLYGITDPVEAKRFAAGSIEADFAGGFYRRGFAGSSSLTALPSWAFTRAGLGTAETAGGGVQTFATGVPRITDRGLLVERAATNLLRYSQDLSNALWVKTGAVVTADHAMAPDGTMTADRVQFGPGAAEMQQSASSGLTNGQPCTISLWAKGAGTLGIRSGVSGLSATRVLASSWQRYTWTFNAASTSEVVQLGNSGLVAGASGAIDADIWGFQIEAGSVATSYIPTEAAASTRAKDEASISASSGSSGGVFVEFDLPAHLRTGESAFSWFNGGTGLTLYRNDAGLLVMLASLPSGDVIRTASGFAGAGRAKAFVGFADGEIVWTVNGVELAPTDHPLPLDLTTLNIGQGRTGGDQLDGVIRRLLVIDYLSTAAQRIAMTGA